MSDYKTQLQNLLAMIENNTPIVIVGQESAAAIREALAELDILRNSCSRLFKAIQEHYLQKADDRCILDDDKLYAAASLPPCDRRVGDKFAMLKNCARFIEQRCEGGGWPSYAELEQKIKDLTGELQSLRYYYNLKETTHTSAESNQSEVIVKLKKAIKDAGFKVMYTSGDWSIHDVSEKAKADDEKTAEVIAKNIDLEIENEALKEMVAKLQVHVCETCGKPATFATSDTREGEPDSIEAPETVNENLCRLEAETMFRMRAERAAQEPQNCLFELKQQNKNLLFEMERLREVVDQCCDCRWEDIDGNRMQVEECHFHACQRYVCAENGDPSEVTLLQEIQRLKTHLQQFEMGYDRLWELMKEHGYKKEEIKDIKPAGDSRPIHAGTGSDLRGLCGKMEGISGHDQVRLSYVPSQVTCVECLRLLAEEAVKTQNP